MKTKISFTLFSLMFTVMFTLLVTLNASAAQYTFTGIPVQVTTAGEGLYFNIPGANHSCGVNGNLVIASTYASFKLASAQIMLANALKTPITVTSDGTCYNQRPNIIYTQTAD